MIRNIRFIKALIKLRLSHLMVFRLGFFGPFFVDGSLFIIQLMVYEAIYSNVDTIGTWGKGEMILFVGTFSLINALNMIIYFFGVISIPDKIRSGDLDLYLTKPVNPLLRITFEKVNPGSIPLVIFSLCIIAYGLKIGNIHVSFFNGLWYLFYVVLMTLLLYDLEVIIRSISFFFISAKHVSIIEEAGLDLCIKIPGIVFKGIYKMLFYVILPYGIIATIPTQSLTGTLNLEGTIFSTIIVFIFTIIMLGIWKIGLKHYNSASS